LTLKLVAIATSFERAEKGQIRKNDQMPIMWWKFCENRSSKSWVLFSQVYF